MMPDDETGDTPLVRLAVECTPVSENARLRKARGGWLYKTREAQDYEVAVYASALTWRIEHGYYGTNVLANLLAGGRVRLTFWGVRGDADNYLKGALDGLAKAFGLNDKTFVEVTSRRVETRGLRAGVRIEVWPAADVAGGAA
jgi:Holliday junction resolvase RusA-like endonuclease